MNKEWNFIASAEGSALILGSGFDFDSMILLEDKDTVIIRITVRKENEYPELAEVSVSRKQLKELLEQG